jgi:DNA-binding transcriptional MerR regulator
LGSSGGDLPSARSEGGFRLYTEPDPDRLDMFHTAATTHGMTVDAVTDLVSCTPPLGSAWDAVQLAAQHWVNAHTADLP